MFKTTKIIGFLSLTTCLFSAGIVAPVLSQKQEYPTQLVTIRDNVTWELKYCTRKKLHVVSCLVEISSSENHENYKITSERNTKLVDNEGNEYYVGRLVNKTKIVGPNSEVTLNVYKDARYKVTIDFSGVPDSVLYAPSLRIQDALFPLGNQIVAFEDVPFINLDGSISDVPIHKHHSQSQNSDRSPAPERSNAIGTLHPICIPLLGCIRR